MNKSMGVLTIGCSIRNYDDRNKSVRIARLAVDTRGAATWIPRRQLEQIQVKPERSQTIQKTNGRLVHRDVGYALIQVSQRETIYEVVFAEKGDRTLLGPRSLSGLMLRFDPKKKKLIEIEAHPVANIIKRWKVLQEKTTHLRIGSTAKSE